MWSKIKNEANHLKMKGEKFMKYKKLKRALAMSLAVLMAVPTVSYGGMSEVHAEEAAEQSDEGAEEDKKELKKRKKETRW